MKLEKLRHVVCALIGHSRYITSFFGYQYCGRCRDQLGDTLGSIGAFGVVSAEHLKWGDCAECEKARPLLTWRDRLLLTGEAKKVEHESRSAAKAAHEKAMADMREWTRSMAEKNASMRKEVSDGQ